MCLVVITEDIDHGPFTELQPNTIYIYRTADHQGIMLQQAEDGAFSITDDVGAPVRVTGLANPTKKSDAVTMGWVQDQIGDIAAVLDAINGEVV